MPARSCWMSVVVIALAMAGCETVKGLVGGGEDEPAASSRDEDATHEAKPGPKGEGAASSATVEPDARDAAGAVALLAALCEHAKAGEDEWVAKRVKLPLRGIHSLNAKEEDQFVHPHENTEIEDFQYTPFCRMLPRAGTKLADYTVTETMASGVAHFGPMPHRIEFDLSTAPPKLVTLDAYVPPRPVPERPAKPRDYELGPPPKPFTDREPEGSWDLRRKTIAFLKKNPACIEDYTTRDVSAVRFNVVRAAGADGTTDVRVEPFQLVRASLLACLRTQISAAPELAEGPPTQAVIEVLIPVSADEFPDAPTVKMPK